MQPQRFVVVCTIRAFPICTILICAREPHAQESVGEVVNLGAASVLVIVGEELFVQQDANGVLDGTGGFQGVLFYECYGCDAGGFVFFGYGYQRLFLLVAE